MKKAFFFTLDALFAVAVLTVFLTAISFEMNVPKEIYWLPGIGNSLMTSLDKAGVLTGTIKQSDASAQQTLKTYLNTLPPNINAEITVKIYSGASDMFTLKRTVQANKGVVNPDHKTHIRRAFASLPNARFGLAELVISYG